MNISESLAAKIPNKFKPPLRVALRTYGRIVLTLRGKHPEAARAMNVNDYEGWYYNRPQAKQY